MALEVRNLSAGYGAVRVLRDVSLTVPEGQIMAVLGRNGAGKSTLARAIMGNVRITEGKRYLDGEELPSTPWDVSRSGVSLVPEGRGMVAELTVEENLLVGARCSRRVLSEHEEAVYSQFPALFTRKNQLAGNLSGGEQQMLAIGRALVSKPKALVLDEPTLGLSPLVIDAMADTMLRLSGLGLAILLLEQNVQRALDIASSGAILSSGRLVAAGESWDLENSEILKEAFLS